MKKEENSLVDFEWENQTEEFFGVKEEETPSKSEEEFEDSEEPQESENNSEELTEEVEESEEVITKKENSEEFFKEESEEEVEQEEKRNIWKDFYLDLKEKGIVNKDLEEDFEVTPESILELSKEEIENQVSARLEHWANDLDDDAKKFIKFKLEGGSTKEFFDSMSKVSYEEGDIENEKYQDKLIRAELSLEGFDEEEIEDRLEYLTQTNKKLATAQRYEKRAEKRKEEEAQRLLEEKKEQKKLEEQKRVKYKQDVKNYLDKNSKIGPFDIGEKEKIELYNFMTKEKNGKVDFQEALKKTFADETKTLLLAKILKDDFDFKSLEKSIGAKKVKQIKTNMGKHSFSSNFGSSYKKKSLADLLE